MGILQSNGVEITVFLQINEYLPPPYFLFMNIIKFLVNTFNLLKRSKK